MKKTMIGGLLVVVILSASCHFCIVYLNYLRTIGIGFTPGISLLKPDVPKVMRKGLTD